MKGRDVLRDLVGAGKPAPTQVEMPHARPAGAVKAMSLGLDRLTEEAAAAKNLREALAGGDNVVELDPALIDPSIITDRIAFDNDPEFNELKSAIESNGQQVPILVRPHPKDDRRFQAAYGHRRIRVSLELGFKVKAIVKKLTDHELVVAQGQENGPRLDLSFIERALFASRMEQSGFDRETVCAALGIDKPEASRLLSVANAIDAEIILAIGPAPKVGRPRWMALVSNLQSDGARDRAYTIVASPAFKEADSNGRFGIVFDAAGSKPVVTKVRPKSELRARGERVAWLERKGKQLRLISDQVAFNSFLEARIPQLLAEFEAEAPSARPISKKEDAIEK
ncbi:plasmid partitioning protein RepB [Ensifer sesbaniae]|uniref:plasmid partitioning protein RepB n=1 Tax=Ensifer sesbaniae TaxID=1214071 RepID=UPI002001075D|nr:plasmid partitioning protein RepB [Ensifer sesbaniae]